MGIQDWSTTAADNDDADVSINWAEGQTAGSVNGSARAMMAAVAAWRDAIGGAKTTTGSSNAYVLTTGLSLTSYINGFLFAFEANHTNTGAATIAVDGLATKDMVNSAGAALSAGAITSGGIYLCAYESGAGKVIVLNAGISTPIAIGDGGTGATTASAARTALSAASSASGAQTGSAHFLFPGTATAKTWRIILKAASAFTITETTSRCASGTCTATFAIDGVSLGGTANSVSSSEQSQTHSTNNAVAAGNDVTVAFSSISSPVDISLTIKYTYTLA